MPYPFKPIQLTMFSVATIGIPSFVLALQPNKARVSGSFLQNVLSKSVPTSLTVVCNILLTILFAKIFKMNFEIYSTICVLLTSITAFILLFKLCRPFNLLRAGLWCSMAILFLIEVTIFRELFYISVLSTKEMLILVTLVIISIGIYLMFSYLVKHIKIVKRRNA